MEVKHIRSEGPFVSILRFSHGPALLQCAAQTIGKCPHLFLSKYSICWRQKGHPLLFCCIMGCWLILAVERASM
jgi:hypothetical protein